MHTRHSVRAAGGWRGRLVRMPASDRRRHAHRTHGNDARARAAAAPARMRPLGKRARRATRTCEVSIGPVQVVRLPAAVVARTGPRGAQHLCYARDVGVLRYAHLRGAGPRERRQGHHEQRQRQRRAPRRAARLALCALPPAAVAAVATSPAASSSTRVLALEAPPGAGARHRR